MSISLDKVGNYSNLDLTRRDRDKNFHSGVMVGWNKKKGQDAGYGKSILDPRVGVMRSFYLTNPDHNFLLSIT